MQTTKLSFETLHLHGDLFVNFLRARRRSFIEKNNWELPEADGMEYDQYDSPASRWVAVHEDGEVLAGIRLTPTTARCGIYSYMIRDAQLGLVDTIPTDLLAFEAPVDPYIWESSRVFVMDSVPSRNRTKVQTAMMKGMIDAAHDVNARIVLGLVPAIWARWIGRLGLTAEPAGPVLDLDGWKTQVAMMQLSKHAVPEIASATRFAVRDSVKPRRPRIGAIHV
ncbi:MAG: acyl-homoserine-lactone synthase [Rhodobacter sp.]|nr:acyl-homoserine-lactone synthase [Rhodobacter sp.]